MSKTQTKLFEDYGSDFAPRSTRTHDGSSKHTTRSQGSHKGSKSSKQLLDDDPESSEDELDFLSQGSRHSSVTPTRTEETRTTKSRAGKRQQLGDNETLIDGEIHKYPEWNNSAKRSLPNFRKIKTVEAEETRKNSESDVQNKPYDIGAKSDHGTQSTSLSSSHRPGAGHKVLGMRPIPPWTSKSPTIISVPKEHSQEETPKPTKQAVPACSHPRTRAATKTSLVVENDTPPPGTKAKLSRKAKQAALASITADTDAFDSDASKNGKGKAKTDSKATRKPQEFPMETHSPVHSLAPEASTASKRKAKPVAMDFPISPIKSSPVSTSLEPKSKPKLATQDFPVSPVRPSSTRSSAGSSTTRTSRIADFPVSPPKGTVASTSTRTALDKPARSSKKQSYRIESESSDSDSTTTSDAESSKSAPGKGKERGKQAKSKARPFPMESQVPGAAPTSPSPGKRSSHSDDDLKTDRESKRIKGADELYAEFVSAGEDMDDDEDLVFLNPGTDPSTLCPWCDEPLPTAPSPYLRRLMAAAKKRSSNDARPTNPLGLYAAPAVFVNVCQRHRFESVQVPLAQERGWPTHIDWSALGGRIRALRELLQGIVDDVDEDFLPGAERPAASEEGDEAGDGEDEEDDKHLRKTRPRKGSAFWREVVKDVRKKGLMRNSGIGGQMSAFSKVQPGYYGELGSMILSQTLYDLFPPSQFSLNSTLPLTPTEFIQKVLLPETAVSLVMQDLTQSRKKAIRTLRESASYGVAMFPDDHDRDNERGGDAGERIAQERAAARRRELEMEGEGEGELWVDDDAVPPRRSQKSNRSRSTSLARESDSGRPDNSRSSRTTRHRAKARNLAESDDTDGDVTMRADDTEYRPSKPKSSKAGKAKTSPPPSSLGSSHNGTGSEKPAPRPRKRVAAAGSNGLDPILVSDSEHTTAMPTPLLQDSTTHRSKPKPRPRKRDAGTRSNHTTDHESDNEPPGLRLMHPSSDVFDIPMDVEETPKPVRVRSKSRQPSEVVQVDSDSDLAPLERARRRTARTKAEAPLPASELSRTLSTRWSSSLRESRSSSSDSEESVEV